MHVCVHVAMQYKQSMFVYHGDGSLQEMDLCSGATLAWLPPFACHNSAAQGGPAEAPAAVVACASGDDDDSDVIVAGVSTTGCVQPCAVP